ncbi:MAG: Gfo/Idh/MocA family oxidoreductase [Chloroflexi bacterium]|nr:Gfo/Idh/MocA family oxidoreductase [Chloroflexota bacterium]
MGVIGCGYWGPKLARNFNELPEAELAWVADYRPERLAHMKELYPAVRTTQHYREVLASDVDAVAIATPVSTHYPLSMEALEAGKHVLVEKPLAATVTEAGQIVEAADRLGSVAMVGHTFQYNPAVRVVRDLVSRGELGEVYYINGTRVNLGLFQPDINVMWDLAPHDVSILLHVLQMDPIEVSAQGEVFVQRNRGIHEVAYLTLRFPKGILANLRVSWLDPVKTRRITIVGSKKMLVYDDIAENKVILYDKGVEVPAYSDTVQEFHMSYRHGPETVVPVEWQEPLSVECGSFVRCVLERESGCVRCEQRTYHLCSSATVGAKVVRVLEAAQKSLLNGGGRECIST